MTRLRLVEPPSPTPTPEERIPGILRSLDSLRTNARHLEAELKRQGRKLADRRGEYMLPDEARLRREFGVGR